MVVVRTVPETVVEPRSTPSRVDAGVLSSPVVIHQG